MVLKRKNYVFGVDFDNTIVSYDEVMHKVASQLEFIPMDGPKSKKDIRDHIRRLLDGESKWQRIQAEVYGPRMCEARLINGVKAFFRQCKQFKAKVNIVSHKTEFARLDQTRTNLRATALLWMDQQGLFDADETGLPRENVYFETTRAEKIKRIIQLGCTHFIDDLQEIFLEGSFPAHIQKILFSPHLHHSSLDAVVVANSWEEITNLFFNASNR